MRSFAELLRDYTARTGVSDTELARALGVSRQTIFRWKEGLVEKPRSREDVLRCAVKLRLSPEERDEILLAAGFAPEVPHLANPSPAALLREHSADGAEATVPMDLASRPRSIGATKALILLALLFLVVAAAWSAQAVLRPDGYGVAPAGSGETLVLIESSPGHPTEGAFAARLKSALEREIAANRVSSFRAELWPKALVDIASTGEAARRTNASLVVTIKEGPDGKAESSLIEGIGGNTAPLISVRPRPSSVEDAQSLALLVLARIYAGRGEMGMARAAILRAQAISVADPESDTAISTYLDQLENRP